MIPIRAVPKRDSMRTGRLLFPRRRSHQRQHCFVVAQAADFAWRLFCEECSRFCMASPELNIERDENGEILIMPPSGLKSSFTNNSLQTEISLWNRQVKTGRVSDSNGGYTLPDTSMRAPDVGWISKERLMSVLPEQLKKFGHVCPDFVIEVRSESDSLKELQTKMSKWINNGVRFGWLVDPQTKTTTIYRPNHDPETKPFTETFPAGMY